MNVSQMKALMAEYGLRPNKRLGQNFLADEAHLRRIAEAAELAAGEWVLEVGPGLGPLTELLLGAGARVVAVELDRGLAAVMQGRFGAAPAFTLHQGDVLAQEVPALLRATGADEPLRYKCVANIPYYITSAVMRHLLESVPPPTLIVLLVQREVAQRIVAQPGDLSLLAVSVQLYGEPEIVATVPAGAFYPAPKVDSAILRVRPFAVPRYAIADRERFFRVVKAGFGQKRKQLRNSLSAALPLSSAAISAALEAAAIDPQRRAQSLSLAEWVRLDAQLAGPL